MPDGAQPEFAYNRLMRFKQIALGLAFLVLLAVAVGAKFALYAFTPARPGSSDTVVIEIHKAEGPSEIARALESQGAITDRTQFLWVGRALRAWKRVKAGEYKVSPGMTPVEILAVIASGISLAHPITVREGENIYEIADDVAAKKLVARQAFLAACRNPELIAGLGFPAEVKSLEGYLYPETYFFNKSMSAEDLSRQMARKFLAIWNSDFGLRANVLGLTRHQVVILASMVEKETGHAPDRPLISSVIHNRLKKGMKLQSDPTSIYGIWHRYKGNLHRSDLADPNPYNTYYVSGLPVGPIGNPGVESIRAALFPASSKFLFFVSHNDGTTEFSESLEAHNRAVRKFQVDPKAREGKSWRDLSGKKKAAGT